MIQAIIWDYDGTLVDTRSKNFEVTKEIMQQILDDSPNKYHALQSIEHYKAANDNSENWRELYKTYFQLSESEINKAGSMWKEYQVKNQTEVTLFDHIPTLLNNFSNYKQGIVSQNAHENILSYLSKQNLNLFFSKVIGYEEISLDQQKPNPTGLLKCIEYLTNFDSGIVVYIGDHESDTQCAYLANKKLKKTGSELRVISVAALYGLTNDITDWEYKPDYIAYKTTNISDIINKLAN